MELATTFPPASPLDADPPGGHVEPSTGLDNPSAPAHELYVKQNGAIFGQLETADIEKMGLAAVAKIMVDGLRQIAVEVAALNQPRLVLGPYVWTTTDQLIRVLVPADRLPLNARLDRIVMIQSSAGAAESITFTDLLPVPFQVQPALVNNEAVTDDIGIALGIPLKFEGFNITKTGGGNFTTSGVLYLDIGGDRLV